MRIYNLRSNGLNLSVILFLVLSATVIRAEVEEPAKYQEYTKRLKSGIVLIRFKNKTKKRARCILTGKSYPIVDFTIMPGKYSEYHDKPKGRYKLECRS